jgi:hypothetical protein
LRGATARNEPDRDLRLAEDRLAHGSETHVHGQRDLIPPTPGPPLDLRNGYFGHVPEPFADHLRQTKAARVGHLFGGGPNAAQSGVSYKEIGKRALQDHDPDALVGLEFSAESIEFRRQDVIEKIYRRVIDADKGYSGIKTEPETFIVRITHGNGSISMIVSVRPSMIDGLGVIR